MSKYMRFSCFFHVATNDMRHECLVLVSACRLEIISMGIKNKLKKLGLRNVTQHDDGMDILNQ